MGLFGCDRNLLILQSRPPASVVGKTLNCYKSRADRRSDGMGWVMDLVPRLLGVTLIGVALAGSGGLAFADDAVPGNAAVIASLPPASQDLLLSADNKSSLADQPQPDRQSGHLDFFSVRPESRSGDFTSLLGSSAGGGGLKFHLNW